MRKKQATSRAATARGLDGREDRSFSPVVCEKRGTAQGGMEHNRGESRSFEGLRRIPFEKDDRGRLRGERGRRKRDREKQASEREREPARPGLVLGMGCGFGKTSTKRNLAGEQDSARGVS